MSQKPIQKEFKQTETRQFDRDQKQTQIKKQQGQQTGKNHKLQQQQSQQTQIKLQQGQNHLSDYTKKHQKEKKCQALETQTPYGDQIQDLFKFQNSAFMKFFSIEDQEQFHYKIKQNIIEVIKQQVWNIKHQAYGKNWVLAFSFMKLANSTELYLMKNQKFCIQDKIVVIQNIKHISFKNLKILRLDRNNIHNLQALSLMQIPNLQQLGLNENKIVTIKSMRKCSLNGIIAIGLWRNKIQVFQRFSQIKFANQIKGFAPQYYLQDKQQQSDISIAAKIQSRDCDKIIINSQQRIIQRLVYVELEKKFTKITIKNQAYFQIR